jgi:hypothetical protein
MIDRTLKLLEANIAQPARSPGILKRTSFILNYATVCFYRGTIWGLNNFTNLCCNELSPLCLHQINTFLQNPIELIKITFARFGYDTV